jgi:hypothetical protein
VLLRGTNTKSSGLMARVGKRITVGLWMLRTGVRREGSGRHQGHRSGAQSKAVAPVLGCGA